MYVTALLSPGEHGRDARGGAYGGTGAYAALGSARRAACRNGTTSRDPLCPASSSSRNRTTPRSDRPVVASERASRGIQRASSCRPGRLAMRSSRSSEATTRSRAPSRPRP